MLPGGYETNEDGIPLARSDSVYAVETDYFPRKYDGIFRIENELLSWCHLRLLIPEYGATISTGRVNFEWEHHPLAASYTLRIDRHRMSYPNLTASDIDLFWFKGDFLVQSDGSLIGPSLPTFAWGTYYWSVLAYTADGGLSPSRVGLSPLEVSLWCPEAAT